MLRWVSFSPSKTQLPSVLPLCFLHPMTGKMFPLSLLAVPLLPFCYLSIWPSLLCSVAKRVILLSPPTHTHTHTHICVSEKRERGKLQDCVYFSRIIEICLDANGRSCPPKCLNISHTHIHTATRKFACEFKQKAFGGTAVGVIHLCMCVGVCIGSANAFAISRSVHMEGDACQPH